MVKNGQELPSPCLDGHFETKLGYLGNFLLSNIIFFPFFYILRPMAAKDRFLGAYWYLIVSPGPDGRFETKHV